MPGLKSIGAARTTINYEELADAIIGIAAGAGTDVDFKPNSLELNLEEKLCTVLSGEYPLDGLPIFPATANALIPRLNDAQLSKERIHPFLVQDPTIAAEIIRFANDSFLRPSVTPVSNVEQAVHGMELESLRSLLLKVLLRPSIPIKPIYFNLLGKPLWEHARDCSDACRKLAYEHQVTEADAALVGLVHDLGKLVIFKLLCSTFRINAVRISVRAPIVARIVQQYGLRLSRFVAEQWHFSPACVTALHEQEHEPDPTQMTALGRNLYFGHLVAEANLVLQKHMFQVPVIETALQQFGLSLNRVYDIFPATPRLAYR
jgi:HD-like signal output (HDOD) protein